MTGQEPPATATLADLTDTGAFLARVVRLDPGGLARLRPVEPGQLELWAWLPRSVLVSRVVEGSVPDDVTVGAADLLARLDAARAGGGTTVVLPPRRDAEWRGALAGGGAVTRLDTVPADVVHRLVTVGEQAFRGSALTAPGADPQTVGEALLDHESLRVSAGGTSVAVPLGMLLAVARMGFLGDAGVTVGVVGGWVRLDARFGAAFRRREDVAPLLSVSPR